MRTPSLVALALLPLALTGAKDDRTRPPAATPSGPAQSCIQLTQIDHTRVHGDRTIDFVMRGGQVYRSTLPYECPELGFEERFSYETSLSELCSTDIITVLREAPLMRGASCGLGQFQPVTLADPRKAR